jgi:hypothetical protein
MQRHSLLLAAAVLFTGLISWPATSQHQDPQPSVVVTDEELCRVILRAKQPSTAVRAYDALFHSATTDSLRRLQMNPSDTIAIQAAWQEVELTVPEKSELTVRPDRDKLSRFLGFLEGRARVQAPRWWAEAILDARANHRGNVYAGGLNLSWRREPIPNAAAPPPQATFDKQDGKPVVRIGSEFALIPEDLRDKLRPNGPDIKVTALIDPARCYVAAYDCVGSPYRLACVERSPERIRWIADVWASSWGAFTGRPKQLVEVIEQGDRVVVFGIASSGFHVEAFRLDDGLNILRFSNSYPRR